MYNATCCSKTCINPCKTLYCWFTFDLANHCKEIGAPIYGTKSSSNYNEGSTITFTCNAGYTLMKSSSRTCREGGWTGNHPKCSGIIIFRNQYTHISVNRFGWHVYILVQCYPVRTRGPFLETPGNYRARYAVLFSIPDGSFKIFEYAVQ